MLIIIKTKNDYDYIYISKQDIIVYDKNKISYSNTFLDSDSDNKGCQVYYDGDTIGEFQFHYKKGDGSGRDNIKFRFYYKYLKKLLLSI